MSAHITDYRQFVSVTKISVQLFTRCKFKLLPLGEQYRYTTRKSEVILSYLTDNCEVTHFTSRV
jgi:hypothetical protein